MIRVSPHLAADAREVAEAARDAGDLDVLRACHRIMLGRMLARPVNAIDAEMVRAFLPRD